MKLFYANKKVQKKKQFIFKPSKYDKIYYTSDGRIFMKHVYIFLFFFSVLVAELPPSVYDNLKADSPEILRIKVLHVKDNNGYIQAEAKVLNVQISKSEIIENDVITINYERALHPSGWVGPSNAILIEENEEYTAFLNCKEKKCSLAARGKSFQKEKYYMQRALFKTMEPLHLQDLSSMDLRIFKPKKKTSEKIKQFIETLNHTSIILQSIDNIASTFEQEKEVAKLLYLANKD